MYDVDNPAMDTIDSDEAIRDAICALQWAETNSRWMD